jgi:hypothetical protein
MIDFDKYIALVLHYFSTNIWLSLALGVIALLLLYKKPLGTLKVLASCLFLITIIYIMSLLGESSSTGVLQKKNMSQKSEMEILDSTR